MHRTRIVAPYPKIMGKKVFKIKSLEEGLQKKLEKIKLLV